MAVFQAKNKTLSSESQQIATHIIASIHGPGTTNSLQFFISKVYYQAWQFRYAYVIHPVRVQVSPFHFC